MVLWGKCTCKEVGMTNADVCLGYFLCSVSYSVVTSGGRYKEPNA